MKRPVEVILRGGQFKQLTEQELTELRKKYDLKRIELEVIYFLSICGDEDTVVSIHDYLNANRGHISQTVFRLCQRGYVSKGSEIYPLQIDCGGNEHCSTDQACLEQDYRRNV